MGGNLLYQVSRLADGAASKVIASQSANLIPCASWKWVSLFYTTPSHGRPISSFLVIDYATRKSPQKCISRPLGQCSSFPFFSFPSSDSSFQVPPKCLTDPYIALTCHPSPVVLSRFRSAMKLLTPSIRLTKNMRRLSFCQTNTPISSAYLRVVSYSVSDWKSLSRNPGVVVMRSRSSCQRWIWSITVAGRTLVVIVGGASGFSELEVDVLAFLRRICGWACVVR